MKEIVRVLLQEGISEEVIHEVLDVINEVSRKFKSERVASTVKKITDYGNAIDTLEKDHPELPKHVIGLLKDDQAKMMHDCNVRAQRVERKEQELIKKKENKKKEG